MNNKKEFINLVEEVFNHIDIDTFVGEDEGGRAGLQFWEEFKAAPAEKPLSSKAQEVYDFMVNNKTTYNNIFTSASIAKELNTSGRSVSGVMRSLVLRGLIDKHEGSPVAYSLTK